MNRVIHLGDAKKGTMSISTNGDGNFRAAIRDIYSSARSTEVALCAEYSQREARLGTDLEQPDDHSRIIEILHRLKSLACATHPEIKAIVDGGPLPAFHE